MIGRGQTWWVDLGPPTGSGRASRRPVLVVSADPYNRSRIRTVVVVTLTTNLRLADAPGNVLLPKGEGGLPKDSVANVSQIVTLDKDELHEQLGTVSDDSLHRVRAGLARVLGLAAPGPFWRS